MNKLAVCPSLTRRARSVVCAVLPVSLVVSVGGAVGTIAVLVDAIGAEGLGLVWLRAHGRVCVCVNVTVRRGVDALGVGLSGYNGRKRCRGGGVQKIIKWTGRCEDDCSMDEWLR
jgi:hypothetical protein